jgi:hypothetical protein
MIFMWLGIALLSLWFVLTIIRLFRSIRKSKALDKRLADQLDRAAADVQKYSRQISVRDAAILKFIHNRYTPATIEFFVHLTKNRSGIDDDVFDKVDAFNEFQTREVPK